MDIVRKSSSITTDIYIGLNKLSVNDYLFYGQNYKIIQYEPYTGRNACKKKDPTKK